MASKFSRSAGRLTRGLVMASLLAGGALGTSACTGAKGGTKVDPGKASLGNPEDARQVEINSRAKLLFEDAVKAYEAQQKARAYDYPSLERKFSLALEADPRLAEAEFNLGVLAERQGKKDEAIRRYQSALQKKPTLRVAAENLAVIAQNAGDIQNAVRIYQDILDKYPDDAASRARLAEIYRQSQDHTKAMELARAALTRDPSSRTAYKVMMRSYLDRKQLSLAKLVALRALKIDENDAEIHHTIGLISLEEGEPDKARAQFKKAVEVRADFQPSHVMLARMALDAEDYTGAEEHLRRILQADGKNAEAHLNLGVAYKGQGQFDKAMQEYDEAEKLNPNLAAVNLNRGVILLRAKNVPEKSLEYFKKYVSLAGGEVALMADSPVFNLIKEAEMIIAANEEAKRMMEEAARLEAAQKQQEEELKRAEAKMAADAKAAEGKGAAPAAGSDSGQTKSASGQAAPAPAKKEAPKKVAPPPAPTKSSDEPSDEPVDDF